MSIQETINRVLEFVEDCKEVGLKPDWAEEAARYLEQLKVLKGE